MGLRVRASRAEAADASPCGTGLRTRGAPISRATNTLAHGCSFFGTTRVVAQWGSLLRKASRGLGRRDAPGRTILLLGLLGTGLAVPAPVPAAAAAKQVEPLVQAGGAEQTVSIADCVIQRPQQTRRDPTAFHVAVVQRLHVCPAIPSEQPQHDLALPKRQVVGVNSRWDPRLDGLVDKRHCGWALWLPSRWRWLPRNTVHCSGTGTGTWQALRYQMSTDNLVVDASVSASAAAAVAAAAAPNYFKNAPNDFKKPDTFDTQCPQDEDYSDNM